MNNKYDNSRDMSFKKPRANVLVHNFSQNEEVTLSFKVYLHLNDSRNEISKVFKSSFVPLHTLLKLISLFNNSVKKVFHVRIVYLICLLQSLATSSI